MLHLMMSEPRVVKQLGMAYFRAILAHFNTKHSRPILALDIWFYLRDLLMAASELLIKDPCPSALPCNFDSLDSQFMETAMQSCKHQL